MSSSNSSPFRTPVQSWLELDKKYRIKGRNDISQVLVRVEGVRVSDADDKCYIDFESGQVYASTGHYQPAYINAIVDQAGMLVQTSSGYTDPPRISLPKSWPKLCLREPETVVLCLHQIRSHRVRDPAGENLHRPH